MNAIKLYALRITQGFIFFQVDYLERAKRIEEIPLLKQEYEEFIVKDKEWFEQAEKEKVMLGTC